MYVILDKILLLKCNCWKWKTKVEIKVNGQYIKGTTIFVFDFLFFVFFITYITFFYEQSIFDILSEYCFSFSKKLPQKIVQQLLCRWSINFKHSKRHLQGQIEYVTNTFELTRVKVGTSLRFPMKKKGFSLHSQWIVKFSSLVRPGKLFRHCLKNQRFWERFFDCL